MPKRTIKRKWLIGASLLGLGVVCIGGPFFSESVPVEHRSILLLASLFLIFRVRWTEVVIVQRIIGLYVIGVFVNQLSLKHLSLSFLESRLTISYGLIGAVLLCGGYLLNHPRQDNLDRSGQSVSINIGWVWAAVIICGHMFVLWFLLRRFYGYGYEHNAEILGNLSLSFLLFGFLWNQLGEARFRQLTGAILSVGSTVAFFTN